MPLQQAIVLLCGLVTLLAAGPRIASSCSAQDALPVLIEAVAKQSDPALSIDFEIYQKDLRRLPIGVFDSGIGGLTVLEALLTIDQHDNRTGNPKPDGIPDFRDERFIYFGDQANMPYGNYASAGKTDFLRELILRDTLFLLGNRYFANTQSTEPRDDKPAVKAIVIACNTATAFGLDDIRAALSRWNVRIPVVGVVEAGGRGVLDVMRADTTAGEVAVLATVGTCDSNAYPRTIARLAGQQGLRVPDVCQQGSVGLAGAIEGNKAFLAGESNSEAAYLGPSTTHERAKLIEELAPVYGFDPSGLGGQATDLKTWKLKSVENYVRFEVTTLVENYRQSGGKKPITTAILGCTHFPLAVEPIQAAFARLRDYQDAYGKRPYEGLVAQQVVLVNPAQYAAKELFRELMLSQQRMGFGEKGVLKEHQFYISAVNPSRAPPESLETDGGFTNAYKYGRPAGKLIRDEFLIVPLLSESRSEELLRTWREKLPAVSQALKYSRN